MIAQASPAAGPLRADPSKRVNYTLGLVLGVDEFQQDQLYHAAGRRGHNRLLHGYGTVWGLRVAAASENGEPEIQVEPGVAVDPHGREIHVADRMCVKLTRWLDRHRPALEALYPDPAAQPLPLAVVLCHRECPTDTVPVPGEPCRSQDDAMAPSRIRESFELKLALRDDAPWGSPPAAVPTGLTVYRLSQPEEQAVRAFGLLLARVRTTTDEALGAEGEEVLMDGVRALAQAASEAVLASPPPADDDPILLPAAEAPEILRRALALWVTEVRPAIRALEDPGACPTDADGACCVLLAEIDLAVTGGWAVAAGQPPIRQDARPYLLHTRLLQEWLIAGAGGEGRPDVDSWATLQILGPRRIRVWVHHDDWMDLPAAALEVLINDAELPAEGIEGVPWAGIRNVWDVVLAEEMSDGDVVEIRFDTDLVPIVSPPPMEEAALELRPERPTRGPARTPPRAVGPVRELALEWSPSAAAQTGTTVGDQLRGPTGEYLDRYGWLLSAFTVYDRIEGGDLTGEYKLPIVAAIRRFPVRDVVPGPDQYLFSNGAEWSPQPLPPATGDLEGRYPSLEIVRLQGNPVQAREPSEGEFLVYREGSPPGGTWVTEPIAFSPESDLGGTYPDIRVERLQGNTLDAEGPGHLQVLQYVESSPPGNGAWVPADIAYSDASDLGGPYPDTRVVRLQGRTVAAPDPQPGQALAFVGGEWVPAHVPALLGAAGGDLEGTYPAPSVVGLRERPLADAAPQEGQVLVYREGSPPGGAWIPEAIAFSPASDLGGDYPDSQVARLQGRTLSAATPADGQVLRFRESSPPGNGEWVTEDPPAGGATGPAGGDLNGSYPAPQIARLQGRTVAAATPAHGQVLQFRESSPPGNGRWVPADAPAGGVSGPAGGDLGGDYPDPQIKALQGTALDAANAREEQFLQLRGETWVPGYAVGAPGGIYQIVAAGIFVVRDVPGDATPVAEPYNGLQLVALKEGMWELTGFPIDQERFIYLVKGTAEGSDVQLVRAEGRLVIRLPGNAGSDAFVELHVEVSAWPRRTFRPREIDPRTRLERDTLAAAETAATPKRAARTTRARTG